MCIYIFIYTYIYIHNSYVFPGPLPLRHPPLDPACKIFVSPPFFSVPPPFKVI